MHKSQRNPRFTTLEQMKTAMASQRTYYIQCVYVEDGKFYDILVMFWNGKIAFTTTTQRRVPEQAITRYVRHFCAKYKITPDKVFGVLHGDTFVRNDTIEPEPTTATTANQKNGKAKSRKSTPKPPIGSDEEIQTFEEQGFVI